MLGWSLGLLIALIIVPLFIGAGAYFLGLTTCGRGNGAVSIMCSPLVRLVGGLALVGAAMFCFLPLLRFIERKLIAKGVPPEQPTGRPPTRVMVSGDALGRPKHLSLGQALVKGRIESFSPTGRTGL